MLDETKLYIGGSLRRASDQRTYENISPWTGKPIGMAADASLDDVRAAIAAARRAFDDTDWSRSHAKRFDLIKNYRALLGERREQLIRIARDEAGAALGAASRAHVDGALSGLDGLLECFADVRWEEDRGNASQYGVNSHRIVVHEPIGVVGAITPWNVPLYINVGKVAAALLGGCTVVLKPAPDTPFMGAYMGELAMEAGLPPGVFNVVTSSEPAATGEVLVTDPRVDLITFTGSTGVGRRIMERGASTLKRVFLELGGKSANIVLDDTPNFAQVVSQSMVVFHAGQGCAVATRLLIPRSRYDEAIKVLEASYQAFSTKWGDYSDPSHVMGPVISRKQLDRVLGYVKLGMDEGARLLTGGNARPDKGDGYFVEPTCFVDVKNSMRIAQEEIFGPVLVVIPFEDDQDAIRIANESEYGLAGAVYSGSNERATRVARGVRAGAISVNGGMCVTGDLPFGGFKASGMGREWGREGIEEFLDTKVIAARVG